MGWGIKSRLLGAFHCPSLPSVSPLDFVSLETRVELCGLEVKVGVVEEDANEGSKCDSGTCADKSSLSITWVSI